MPIMPRLAMKGGSFPTVISPPVTAPQAAPVRMPTRTATGTDCPACRARTAVTPARVSTLPRDRSIPSVRITRVAATPMMRSTEPCSMMLRKFPTVKKPGAVTPKNAIMNSTTQATGGSFARAAGRSLSGRVLFATPPSVMARPRVPWHTPRSAPGSPAHAAPRRRPDPVASRRCGRSSRESPAGRRRSSARRRPASPARS